MPDTTVDTNDGEKQEKNSEKLYSELEFLPAAHGPNDLRSRHQTNMAMVGYITNCNTRSLRHAWNQRKKKNWLLAIEEKTNAITDDQTFLERNYPPPYAKPLPSGAMLRLKRDCKENVCRFEARLVGRGNLQTAEAGDISMFGPVPCIELA